MPPVVVIGLGRIQLNLKRRSTTLAAKFQFGAVKAGLLLQRESQRLVPVEYSVLKNSAYTRSIGVGLNATVYVGYTASYALTVHEAAGTLRGLGVPRPSGKGNYWDPSPQAQPKFLEQPARALAPKMRAIIIKEMTI
jgi:hypothetical protein